MRGTPDYTTEFTVDESPRDVFAAITNVPAWWSGTIDGDCDRLGARFTYRYQDEHRSTQEITEFVPGAKIVWQVVDSYLRFVKKTDEWTGTRMVFEISESNGKTRVRFTHAGLKPEEECYDSCSNAWRLLINGNLKSLITTGKKQPDPFA